MRSVVVWRSEREAHWRASEFELAPRQPVHQRFDCMLFARGIYVFGVLSVVHHRGQRPDEIATVAKHDQAWIAIGFEGQSLMDS